MAETVLDPTHAKSRRYLWMGLLRNPVVVKELRARMRGWRALLILSIYLFLISLLVGLIYLGYTSTTSTGISTTINQVVGKTVFGVVVGMELLMICFVAPALTAGAISSERERQTYDLLRTTLLPARSLVIGKLSSALFFLLLLLFVGFPIQSLAFLFGGVNIEEVLISSVMLVVTSITFCTIGLFISSFMKSTLASTVISYVTANLMVFFQPSFLGVILAFFSMVSGGALSKLSTFQQLVLEVLLLSIGYLFVSLNPLAAAIATEIMILEEQNAFYVKIPLSNGKQFPIIGPWIVYCLVFTFLSLLLVWLSIHFVRRAER